MRNQVKRAIAVSAAIVLCLFPSGPVSAAALRMALIADNHYSISDSDSPECSFCEKTHKALDGILASIENDIKPDLVVFLGDAVLGEGATKLNEQQTLELNRLFKSIADKALTRPYLHAWGNHDGPNFPKVFGPGNRSEVIGGYNLMLLSIDYINWNAGLGKFSSWDTISSSVNSNSDKISLAFIHTPIVPPVFNNSLSTRKFLEKFPQIKIVFQGHLHGERLTVVNGILYATLDQAFKPPFFPFYEAILNDNYAKIVRYDLKDGKYSGSTIWESYMNKIEEIKARAE